MTLFDNVKKLANKKGMSLQEVAKKSGMGINSIYKWKSPDYNPSKPAVIAVANTLGISEKELKGETNPARKTKQADLADDSTLFTYEGKPIDDEDKEIIRRLLRGK